MLVLNVHGWPAPVSVGVGVGSKNTPNTITIVIFNHKDWWTQKLTLTKQDTHVSMSIPPSAFQYALESQRPSYYNQHEPSINATICVHSLDTSPVKHTFATRLQQLNQHEHNLDMPNPTITTKFYIINTLWKMEKVTCTTHPSNHCPMLKDLYVTKPLKYNPQTSLYTNKNAMFRHMVKNTKHFHCAKKWISNDQIHHILSNSF